MHLGFSGFVSRKDIPPNGKYVKEFIQFWGTNSSNIISDYPYNIVFYIELYTIIIINIIIIIIINYYYYYYCYSYMS